jgi:hypothetical protein
MALLIAGNDGFPLRGGGKILTTGTHGAWRVAGGLDGRRALRAD